MKNLSKSGNVMLLLLGLILVSQSNGQTIKSPAVAAEEAANRTLETRSKSMEFERIRKSADREATADRNDAKEFPEIKEDFEKIQVVNLDSIQKIIVKDNPDYRLIGKAARDIQKRALRLNGNLFPKDLTAAPNEAKISTQSASVDLSKADLKTLSIALDNSIYRFVSNNLFRNIKVVNLNDSARAQLELKKIVTICSLIEEKAK